ncbi:MAG: LPS export ABC transporter ATP-binding protein [bacterium]
MGIIVQKVKKSYKKQSVVNNVSFVVERGEIVGLLGPNGAGKTTTFYIIVGLIQPESGNIFYNDKRITSFPMYKRAKLGINYLPQESSIFRKLTVWENFMVMLEMQNMTKREMIHKTTRLLKEFDITYLKDKIGEQLSGGERRRVEIARSLTTSPKFILLDEPFAGVDPISIAEIQDIIKYLKTQNLGILITDHNVRETLNITDKAYILHKGSILISGKSSEIRESKIARKYYLGERFFQ